MTEEVSFIHAADLHLDSPFKGLAQMPDSLLQDIRNSTFRALDRLVAAAIDKKVDFVLLAGDLFDNEKQSLKAQIRLRDAFETMRHHHIAVYLSYGNHDYINGNVHPVTYPNNVFIFPDERVRLVIHEKNGMPCAAIYGFSYENKAVQQNKALEYDMADQDVPFHIAMLHGSLPGDREHDVYAPFQIRDLLAKGMDYWALGHIHRRTMVNQDPPIVYPGNIQGRNRKENGEKGCYHVTLSKTGARLSFLPLQAIKFQAVSLDVTDCRDAFALENRIRAELEACKDDLHPQLVHLGLESEAANLQEWENAYVLEDVVEWINETLMDNQAWQYIYRVQTKSKVMEHNRKFYESDPFFGELLRQFQDASIQPYIKELWQHKQARKYVELFDEQDEQRMKEKAEALLLHELSKRGH